MPAQTRFCDAIPPDFFSWHICTLWVPARCATTVTNSTRRCAGHVYVSCIAILYSSGMDVAVTELRAHLGRWIDAARDGNDIVITDRGMPVARIVALDSTPVIDRLTAQGVISRPTTSTRPVAGDRHRPTPKRPVADIVGEQRR